MATASKQKPSFSPRAGNVQCAVWPNEKGPSFVFQKSYKVGKNWKTMKLSLFSYELPMLRQVLGEIENRATRGVL